MAIKSEQQSYNRKQKRELRKEKDRSLVDFMKIRKHYFPNLNNWIKGIDDPRHQSYITYTTLILINMIIFKNVCSIKSMRSMTEQFNEETCIDTMNKLFKENLDELPHCVTINEFLERLLPSELSKIRCNMIKEIIKKRSFESSRFKNKYWKVLIDATGLYSFNKRHCEHCLTKTYKNKETGEVERIEYYHNVLEAKIILSDKVVISLDTEFIENESEDVTKQDCEINAFKRLAKRIKQTYPRLPICIIADSLYAGAPVFKICKDNSWEYIIRFKEGSIPSVAEEFKAIRKISPDNNIYSEGDEVISWVNDIDYKGVHINILEYVQTDKKKFVRTFTWISSENITEGQAAEVVKTGRDRWMIENEGFNIQKNHRYDIQHLNSKHVNAMKNHYLLTQISDILLQLYTASIKILKKLKKTFKKISSDMLEAFRKDPVTPEDLLYISKRIAISSG